MYHVNNQVIMLYYVLSFLNYWNKRNFKLNIISYVIFKYE